MDDKMPAHSIMFHHFHDGQQYRGAEGSLTADDLERIIDHYDDRLIGADEWLDRRCKDTLDEQHVCLSMDDALKCQIDVALPVLAKRNLTAFWFVYSTALQGSAQNFETHRHFRVNSFADFDAFFAAFYSAASVEFGELIEQSLKGFVPKEYLAAWAFYSDNERTYRFIRDRVLGPERIAHVYSRAMADANYTCGAGLWMTEGDVRSLSDNRHVIGLHSYSHPMALATMTDAQQRHEYTSNLDHVRAITRVNPTTMAHPVNSYSAVTLSVLQDIGIEHGFCTTMAPGNSSLELPRDDAGVVSRRLSATAA